MRACLDILALPFKLLDASHEEGELETRLLQIESPAPPESQSPS